ncbi:hypothetical protein K445DRAFT_374636 [Daldinia sp. EC12]|nr:hypothetical protein F4774DRAFT_422624 [Daldinia eschscholtzii]OTB17505.1 hypothetical protein K445DRAFT_374636 [Daldinia sp. EC12]
MGVRPDYGWVEPANYTQRFAAVLKIARALVYSHSVIEREEQVRRYVDEGLTREAAEAASDEVFAFLDPKMTRFMTRPFGQGGQRAPTPVSWILDTFAYGKAIASTTPAEGRVFRMSQLRDMLHTLIDETRDLMGQLLFLSPHEETGEREGFPAIPWGQLRDNPSESRLGHSFVRDESTPWPLDGKTALLSRVTTDPALKKAWLGSRSQLSRSKASDAYRAQADEFRGRLLVLMHMTGGQPARSTELLGLRVCNTKQAGIRNVFIEHDMVTGWNRSGT